MSDRYNFKVTESKWRKIWEDNKTFSTTPDSNKPKYYILEMFPYPSGKIHMGHVRNYTIGDVIARYKKCKGFNVLHPMGWDAFGLPAENAAKENGIEPLLWTYENIKTMKEQIKALGFSINWDKELITCSADYYIHEQKMFIEFFKSGLAYKKESWVNWDPLENTVLANEQVVDGRGWRSGAVVEQKQLSQWFLKITTFADQLLQGLDNLPNWPLRVKNMQQSWIGKSKGATVYFKLDNHTADPKLIEQDNFFTQNNAIKVYTTRADTLFGCSFVALSVRHPLVISLCKHNKELETFVASVKSLGTAEENIAKEEKLGFDTSLYVINPINNERVKLFVANYVLDYATLSIFGCPAHDIRDFEFAKKYNLPIITVCTKDQNVEVSAEILQAFEEDGYAVNSSFLNGLPTALAKQKAIAYLQEHNLGVQSTSFKLKDWGVSRQRYWGCPIPMVYCKICGVVPEKEENLPITLPKDIDLNTPNNPLDNHPTWKHTTCPKCGKQGTRETDTFDTFFESSWYYLRYATIPHKDPFDEEQINYWMSVDQYIGGVEHAVMHLLYSRFFILALKHVGLLKSNFTEPFNALMTQGMICHKTYKSQSGKWLHLDELTLKDEQYFWTNPQTKTLEKVIVGRSEKMSKSKKNTVDPSYICNIYGADTARMFVLSDSPVDNDLQWSDEGIEGIYKFVGRFWRLINFCIQNKSLKEFDPSNCSINDAQIYSNFQLAILNIEKQIETLHLNKAIALNRELFNSLEACKDTLSAEILSYCAKVLLMLFNPFIPHICEQLWEDMGNSTYLAEQPWIQSKTQYILEQKINLPVQILGKTKGAIDIVQNTSQDDIMLQIMQSEAFIRLLKDKEVLKVIYVPNRIINIIVK